MWSPWESMLYERSVLILWCLKSYISYIVYQLCILRKWNILFQKISSRSYNSKIFLIVVHMRYNNTNILFVFFFFFIKSILIVCSFVSLHCKRMTSLIINISFFRNISNCSLLRFRLYANIIYTGRRCCYIAKILKYFNGRTST